MVGIKQSILAALFLGLGYQQGFAAGADGEDVQISCPCSITAESVESGSITIGATNIGTTAVSDLVVDLFVHTENNISVNAEYIGSASLGSLAAGGTLAPASYPLDFQGPTSESFFITVQLIADDALVDEIRMTDQVALGGSFNATGLDFLADVDSDGVADYNETLAGTDANDSNSTPGASTVDVMVIYDASLPAEYNNDHQARIDHIITVSNQALLDSNVDMQLRLVETQLIDSTQNFGDMLNDGSDGTGLYSELPALRTQFGADIVSIVTARDDTPEPSCGVAYGGGYAQEGFMSADTYVNVSDVRFDGCDDMTVLHEIGHNMGLGHSAAQDSTGTFVWSRGYGVTDQFHTIMSYGDPFNYPPQVQVISNPDVSTCAGLPCGIAVDQTKPANAAMSLNIVRFQVAGFRDTVNGGSGEGSGGGQGSGGAEASNSDTDGDGIPNVFETFLGSDPEIADAGEDADEDGVTNQQEFDALPTATQYLQTNSASINVTRLHIVNSSNESLFFTGTLFNGLGEQLGVADQNLSSSAVASKGRLILTSSDIETIFATDTWSGPAMLEVRGSGNFELMAKLVSPSGLISNTNCVRQDRVLNIEGADSENRTFVRFINTTSASLGSITGTLFDVSGGVIGDANVTLVEDLGAKQQVWVNRDEFAVIVGETWDGEAMLEVDSVAGLQLLNLNFVNNETFFNFSCFESSTSGRIFLQTTSTSVNVSLTHIVNTSDTEQQFSGTIFSRDGVQLGQASQVLHDGMIAAKGRVIVSSTELENRLGASAWSGPAVVEITGSDTFELMTKLTSPSGLVSNTNCIRVDQVHNIEGTDSSEMTYVRLINIGDSAIDEVTGSLYDASGEPIGQPNQVLTSNLASKSAVWVNRNELSELFGEPWNGEAMLEVASDPNLKLLNLNFVNSETFFNFSCYQQGN